MSKQAGFVLLLAIMATSINAELRPISDDQLSEVTGQAFVSIDRQYHPDETDNTSYTRVNLGMDVNIQTNIDALEIGRYEREGENAGSSDVLIENFSLGYINNQPYFDRNPKFARQYKPDGSAYAEGEIVPFSLRNPFFEFAFDESTDEVVGVRLGFGEAMGVLSGDIQSLTGNVNIDIVDQGEGLSEANTNGNLFDSIIVALALYLVGSNAITSRAELVYGAEGDPRLGELDPIRAQYAGVPNGETFVVEDVPFFTRLLIQGAGAFSSSQIEVHGSDVHIIAQDCQVLGIQACFSLTDFKSLPVGELGEINGERAIIGPESGLFLSFQTQDLDWLDDVSKTDFTPEDFIRATSGGFFNIPNGSVEFNLNEALGGIERQRVEYIDRGQGLF